MAKEPNRPTRPHSAPGASRHPVEGQCDPVSSQPSSRSEAIAQCQVDELVLVVHGVGDPPPGETLSLFARSLAESKHPLTEHQETVWLKDDSADNRDIHTFATHVRRLDFDGDKHTILAEVYWGDLSRVRSGTLGVILGLISTIFGLRYVAYVAAHQSGFAAKNLQVLGLACSRILHGPMLGVNYMLGSMLATIVITETLWPGSSTQPTWTLALVSGCAALCLLSSYIGFKVTRNQEARSFWFWVVASAVFLVTLLIVSQIPWLRVSERLGFDSIPLAWYCRVFVVLLGTLWISLVLVLALMFVCWGAEVFGGSSYRPALHVALILPAIAIGFWGILLPVLWMWAFHAVHIPSVTAELAKLSEEAMPLLGVQFISCILLATLLIIQLVRYARWRERRSVNDFEAGERAPRLIVPPWIQVLSAACAVGGILVVTHVATMSILGASYREYPVGRFLAEAKQYAIGLLVPILPLLVLSMRYLRPGMDIVLDVVNHFYFRSPTVSDMQTGETGFDIAEVSMSEGRIYFSQRDAIHRRMKRVLEYYRNTLSGTPALTIVSHSQGTIIAVEVLNDLELDWVNGKFSQVNMITMGSPLRHIYQHYFRHLYPMLDDTHWAVLRARVDRWLNIFRIDDYVGTDIVFPEQVAGSNRYSNHAVGRKGHQNYWRDGEVLSVIRKHDICRSLTSGIRVGPKRYAA